MTAQPPSSRPDRIAVRSGVRPSTDFGHDDVDADAELVVIHTSDHRHWDGLHMRPRVDHPQRGDTLAIVVHGSLGNFMGGVPRRLTFELAHAGYPVLSVNTRMANFGVVYGSGLFDETPHDLDGAMDMARELGFTRVVLVGYSLGASMVTHYQALREPPEVVGVCTLAHPWSLPESLRRRWTAFGATPSYTEVERAALRAGIDRDGPDDVIVVRRGAGRSGAPEDAEVWTLRTWWQCRGPEAINAVSVDRIRDVTVPVALIQAGADPVLPGGDGEALAVAATTAGVPVHLEHVPHADHTFWQCVPLAADRAVAWMDTLPREAPPASPPPRRPRSVCAARLVTIPAPDGIEHDAIMERDEAAFEKRVARTGRRTAIVHLHGNQGNLTVGALRFLREPVAASGVPILTLDTRIGNVAQLFGTAMLADALVDVRAAVHWLAAEGYDHVLVSGYSLGASVAMYVGAHELDLPLVGVAGLGTAYSLADSSRVRMDRCGSAPSYEELVAACRPYADASTDEDITVVIHRMYLPDDAPHAAGVYTARSWWHSRGPEAFAGMAYRHIGDIPAPVLLVQGTADVIVDPADAERLAAHARDEGHDDVEVMMLAGQGHGLDDHVATAAALQDWLDRVV